MNARWMFLVILAWLASGCGPSAEEQAAAERQAILNQYLGDWVQSVPSGDSLANILTCRVTPAGQFRLIFQHGHLRPFGDHRGRWTLLDDGRLGVRFDSAGTEPDTITVYVDQGRLIVPFPLREQEQLVFGQRRGAPPSTE